jgi:hypothetical protein
MKKLVLILALMFPSAMVAQTAALNGYCTQGSFAVLTSGLPSSNLFQNLIPQCTITVYLTGTINLASIYADANNTPLTNPFTASTKAQWLFFAATGQGYDVVMSGGFQPLVYTVPVTLTDLLVATGGGSAGCTTSGIAGTLVASNGTGGCQPAQVEVNNVPLATPSPINFIDSGTVHFTNPGAGQITAAVIPGSTFTVDTNTAANASQVLLNFTDTATIKFTNPSGGVESATCVTATSSLLGCSRPDNTTVTISGGVISSITTPVKFEAEDVLLGGQFSANPQILDFNSTLPVAPSGDVNCTWQPDPETGRLSCHVPLPTSSIQMQVNPPDTNQGVFVPFMNCTPNTTNSSLTTTLTCGPPTNPNSGQIATAVGGIFNHDVAATLTWSLPNTAQFLPAGAVITNAYGVSYNSTGPGSAAILMRCGVTTPSVSVASSPAGTQATTLIPSVTNANIASVVCQAEVNQSVFGTFGSIDTTLVGTWIEYTGAPPPANTSILVQYPLAYTANLQTLGITANWPNSLSPLLFSQLPTVTYEMPSGWPVFMVSDNTTTITGNPCAGAGVVQPNNSYCQADGVGGYLFAGYVGGSGGGGSVSLTSSTGDLTLSPSPITGTGTIDLNLAHANTWSAVQTLSASNALVLSAMTGTSCLEEISGVVTATGSACGSGGGSGFPITLGSTSIASGSTTTAVAGLSVNGVTLNSAGSSSLFLNQAGGYTTPAGSGGLSGMTAGQVPIAATATTVTSSKVLAGSGAGITTGPTTSTNLDCAQFSGTTGQIADAGAPCGSGGSTGNIIYVNAGTGVDVGPLITTADTTLGSNSGTIIVSSGDTETTAPTLSSNHSLVLATAITWAATMTLPTSSSGQTISCPAPQTINTTYSGSGQPDGIWIQGTSIAHVTIRDCRVIGNSTSAGSNPVYALYAMLVVYGGNDIKVLHNTLTNMQLLYTNCSLGVSSCSYSAATTGNSTYNVAVDNNTIDNTGAPGLGSGVNLVYTYNAIVAGNNFQSPYYGMWYWGGDSNTDNTLTNTRKTQQISVENNIVSVTSGRSCMWGSMGQYIDFGSNQCTGGGSSGDTGYDVEGTWDADIHDNKLQGPGFPNGDLATFYDSTRVTFHHNHIYTTSADKPFRLNASASTANNVIVTLDDNTFDCTSGVCASEVNGMEQFIVHHNHFFNATLSTSTAVSPANSNQLLWTDNDFHFSASTSFAIEAFDFAHNTNSNGFADISGNTVESSATQSGGTRAIYAITADSVLTQTRIVNNKMIGVDPFPIDIECDGTSSGNSCLIKGNTLASNDIVETGSVAANSSGNYPPVSVSVSSGTQGANSCSSATTITIPGVNTSSMLKVGYSVDQTSLTGWGSSAGMVFQAWPSAANTVSWKLCNQTASSITYSGDTFVVED